MPLYHIWTIGCQMNKAESERLCSLFEQIGYQPAASIEEADLIILNSCVIRQSAENKVVSKIGTLKSLKKNNPGLKIALTGCLVDPIRIDCRRDSRLWITSSKPAGCLLDR